MQKTKNKAFTLVELIVVITILAILGTIAFISLQGYSKDARDSTRVSDLSNMKTALEIFQLDTGKYPIPTDGTNITYSGATVWIQGTFGETVYTNTSKLDKIPTDSLTDAYYTYSTTQNRGEYQLGGILEGDTISFNQSKLVASSPLIRGELREVFAAGTIEARAIVTGTYNGQVAKSLSGSNDCNILAVPSIITNDTSITDLNTINTQNRFVYRGQKNLPSSFKSSKFNNEGGFTFSSNSLVAYSDTGSCSDLTSKTNPTARVQMLKGIQNAYTGTILKDEGEIKNILALDISDVNNPSTEVKNYAGLFVNNNLGGNVGVGNLGNTDTIIYKNCKENLDNGNNINGTYTIDTDGLGGNEPFQVYCDMTGGGWTLLAYYRTGYYVDISDFLYNTTVKLNNTGGSNTAPSGWFPNPSINEYGHLDFTKFNISGKELKMGCGLYSGGSIHDYEITSTLFSDWNDGIKGTYGDIGNPGWGVIGSESGSSHHRMCGYNSSIAEIKGIGYCSGNGSAGSWSNHKVSFGIHLNSSWSGNIGCNGNGNGIDGSGTLGESIMGVWIK